MESSNLSSSPRGCPAPEALSAFFLGQLPPGTLEAVADHLDGCPGCQSGLRDLDGKEDALIVGLRQSAPAEPFSEEPECRQVLHHLQALDLDAVPPAGPSPQPGPRDEPLMQAGPSGLGQLGQYQLLDRLGRGG